MTVTAAMYARLAGDTELTGLLAVYAPQPGTTGPAIFTTDPVPADARLPYVVVPAALADNPFDTKDLRGREVYRTVRCYTARTGSVALLERIALRVRDLFHRHRLVVAGAPALLASVTGPRQGPVEDDAYGLILTVRLKTDPA